MQPPLEKILLFRITHIENLALLAQYGSIPPPTHQLEGYKFIGDKDLTQRRRERKVPIDPGGKIHEYVAFYLGPCTPMLYQITRQGKVQPEEIIYLCVPFLEIEQLQLRYVFTDGHSHAHLTSWYNDKKDLDKLDWEVVCTSDWRNTEDDPDRKRRKQAEFLVKGEVPLSSVKYIVTHNQHIARQVEKMLDEFGLPSIKVYCNPKGGKFYRKFYF